MTEVDSRENKNLTEFVSLQSSNQGYCIEITFIREIRRWNSVTPLPYSDPAILGVMNLRGAVIPIVDLAVQLGMPKTEVGERSVVIIISLEQRVMGLLVDVVTEILTVEESAIQPNPTRVRDEGANPIIGLLSVGDQMLKVLDVENLCDENAEEAA